MNDTERQNANEVVVELLRRVVNDQWSGRINRSCHCHPEYVAACPECKVTEWNERTDSYNDHETACERTAIIERARAYLRAENEIATDRGDDEWEVP